MALKTSGREEDRERFDTLRQRAKVLNFGIPGGLGPRSLVAYARSTYGVTLTLEEAGEFRRRLIEEVYPELGLYLADDGMETLARNLGAAGRGVLADGSTGRGPLGGRRRRHPQRRPGPDLQGRRPSPTTRGSSAGSGTA